MVSWFVKQEGSGFEDFDSDAEILQVKELQSFEFLDVFNRWMQSDFKVIQSW